MQVWFVCLIPCHDLRRAYPAAVCESLYRVRSAAKVTATDAYEKHGRAK
jgi:hypothetical protein